MHLTSLSTVKLSCFAWPHEMKAILQSPMQGQPKRFLVFLRLTSRLLSLEVEASLRSEVSQKQRSFPGLKKFVEAYAIYELSQLFEWELMTSQYRTSALTSSSSKRQSSFCNSKNASECLSHFTHRYLFTKYVVEKTLKIAYHSVSI